MFQAFTVLKVLTLSGKDGRIMKAKCSQKHLTENIPLPNFLTNERENFFKDLNLSVLELLISLWVFFPDFCELIFQKFKISQVILDIFLRFLSKSSFNGIYDQNLFHEQLWIWAEEYMSFVSTSYARMNHIKPWASCNMVILRGRFLKQVSWQCFKDWHQRKNLQRSCFSLWDL